MGRNDQEREKLTPPQLARKLGVGTEKVLGWIRTGELRAINGATKPGGRPRYLIDQADVELFEAARRVVPKKPSPIRARHSGPAKFTKFF
ncbi:MAG TPA: DNA-binding protein [Planctomycetaceae bacterium]|jgi:hypothetical protein|nr:DNA-binding protein [Planctomycetaceae bacterium]